MPSQIVIQNQLALDYILAAQGRVCALINTSCCFSVNQNQRIKTDTEQIRTHLQVLHEVGQEQTFDALNWLISWFPNIAQWAQKLTMFLIIIPFAFCCLLCEY